MCQWFRDKNPDWLKSNSQDKRELTPSEIESILRQVSRHALVSFSGGEPFMRGDMLDILSRVSRRNRCHVITNGTLLSRQDCRALVNLGPRNILGKGLVLAGVSVQAPEEDMHDKITGVSGSFRSALQTIKEIVGLKRSLKKKYPLVNMKIVICQDNVNRLVDYFELAESLGVDICNFMLQHNIIENLEYSHQEKNNIGCRKPPDINLRDIMILKNQLEEILSKRNKKIQIRFSPELSLPEIINHYVNKVNLKHYRCFSAWSRLYIHPYGHFSICYYCDYGNARMHRIRAVWNSETFSMFRKKLKTAGVFPGCAGCCQLIFNARG